MGSLAKIRYGLSQPPEEDVNGIPVIRATNINEGKIIESDLLKAKRVAVLKDVILHQGDIIVVRSGAYTGDIGYISQKFEGCFAGYDLIVTPHKEVDSIFLTQYLLSSKVQNYFSQLKSRVAQPHLNSKQLSDTEIYLPPYYEQKQIAAQITHIENLLELNIVYRTKIQEIKKGLMQNLLTGKIRVKI